MEEDGASANNESLRTVKRTVNPRSIKNLRPWQKGESGNPGGRPRKPISDAYADLAEHPFPGDKHGRTYAQRLAEAQFRAAIKGRTEAAREIANRIEGPAESRRSKSSPEPIRSESDSRRPCSQPSGRYTDWGLPIQAKKMLRQPSENLNEPSLDQFVE